MRSQHRRRQRCSRRNPRPRENLTGNSYHHLAVYLAHLPRKRPVNRHISDRHSPVFPAASPPDPRRSATPGYPDRSYEESYFQRPAASRQYSYSSRPDQTERPGLQPPPRPNHPGARPGSPRYVPQFASSEAPRNSLPSSTTSGWSSQSQQTRSEYFSRDTSSSFRPHSEQRPPPPPPIHRPEHDIRGTFRDGHLLVAPSYSAASASTNIGDIATGKDGLGPKIWTGTLFLPRFVRQAEVAGEGLCYFYDDGTHCKAVIDGEVVNAHWGVTKAGKPRKRLAIACITCREKKIKCDPDFPRCVQCEKFGRVCKFKNA